MKELTVDDIMNATDSPLFFGWKDLKPLLNKKSIYDDKWLFFISSKRRIGKSTTIARYFLADYIANGVTYMYMRRTDELLWKTMHSFFDQAIKIMNRAKLGFQIVSFECKTVGGKTQYFICINWDDEDYTPEKYTDEGDKIDMTPEEIEEAKKEDIKARTEVCGYAISLRKYESVKSAGFDGRGIRHFVYDEFIAEQSTDYLGTSEDNSVEWSLLMSIYMSVDSDVDHPFLNKCNVFCLGNRAHDNNPLLLGAGVNIYLAQSPEATCISPKKEEWVYYEVQGTETFAKLQKQSRAYRAMQHDKVLQDYNFNNVTKDKKVSNELIIPDMPKGCEYNSTVIMSNKYYGIYYRERDGLVYVSSKKHGTEYVEALDIESYYNNNVNLIINNWHKSMPLSLIYESFTRKHARFSDKKTQVEFLQYLDFMPK